MHTIAKHPRSANPDIVFFDDFTSPELNRSTWNVEITGEVVNNEQQAYTDSPETIYISQGNDEANGILVIHPRYLSGYVNPQGKTFDFVSGRINTHNTVEFTYGVVSARISLPAGSGLWPAFWALGTSGQWPHCGEIDIMENVGEPDWTSVAVHGPGYSGETPLVNKKFRLLENAATSWHVYSLECSPSDVLVFRIDGELIYRVTRPMVEFYGPWVYDSSKYLIINCALGGTYPFKTNGVRSPYRGIPEETVQSIRNNEPKMLVDWVKVARI